MITTPEAAAKVAKSAVISIMRNAWKKNSLTKLDKTKIPVSFMGHFKMKIFASMKGKHQSVNEEYFFKNMQYKQEYEVTVQSAYNL